MHTHLFYSAIDSRCLLSFDDIERNCFHIYEIYSYDFHSNLESRIRDVPTFLYNKYLNYFNYTRF